MAKERKALDFRLPDQNGKMHSLKEFKGKSLVLYFYPRSMTPGCTIEAKQFSNRIKEFRALNAEVVGVSNDDVAKQQKFTEKCSLKILLLSDEKSKTIKDYGAYGNRGVFGVALSGTRT